eukprot:364050-Chlamydomonas_euryale.AAC.18
MSSRPLSRQSFRNESISKRYAVPSARVTVCASRSMSICLPASQSSIRASTCQAHKCGATRTVRVAFLLFRASSKGDGRLYSPCIRVSTCRHTLYTANVFPARSLHKHICTHLLARQHDWQHAVLEAVVEEDVGKRRRDDCANAKVMQRPRRMLARRPAPKVVARDEDRRVPKRGHMCGLQEGRGGGVGAGCGGKDGEHAGLHHSQPLTCQRPAMQNTSFTHKKANLALFPTYEAE